MKRVTVNIEEEIYDLLEIDAKRNGSSVAFEGGQRIMRSYEVQHGVVHRATVKHETPCDLDRP